MNAELSDVVRIGIIYQSRREGEVFKLRNEIVTKQ